MERIDTHKIIKEMMAAGLHELQAESITKAMNDLSNQQNDALATKEDIRDLEVQIKLVQMETKLSIQNLSTRVDNLSTKVDKLLWWVIPILVGLALEISLIGWYK